MTDQSTPGTDPTDPEQPATPAQDETAALPQADGAVGAGDTAALPPQPPAAPGWGAAPTAAAPAPPGWTPGPAAAAGTPSGPRRWWNEATSTGGGRAALVAVAVLGAFIIVAGIGLSAALVVAHHRGGDDRGFVTSSRDRMGQRDQQGPGQRHGMGQGKDQGQRQGQGQGQRQGPGQGRPQGGGGMPQAPGQADPANPTSPRQGMGMGAAAGALGAVLHGEFTTNLSGTPTVMLVQTGQVTAYTAGKSLTVKSTDGFEATYTLDGSAVTAGRGSTTLANGVQVRVVAAKDGMKVTALVVG
jgi:hypothetical protein